MNLYRDFAYAEVGRDLLVQPSAYHQRHDLALPWRQSFEANFQLCHRSFLLELCLITGMTELNCFKQILLSKRLCQEFDRATLHRLHRHWNIAMPCDEDNWQLSFGTCQFALQLESALARKPHVKHQASGSFRPIRCEKFVHRTEQVDPKARRSKQLAECVPHPRIIVDDDHCRRLVLGRLPYHMFLLDMRNSFGSSPRRLTRLSRGR